MARPAINRNTRIILPTLHAGQERAYLKRGPGQNLVLRCGRRWGKSKLLITIACDAAIKGQYVGWFTPDYKTLAESYTEIAQILAPLNPSSNRVDGVIRMPDFKCDGTEPGRIDFWTLDNDRAGRSRKYHIVIVDEAAFAKNSTMSHIWDTSIEPTMADYGGYAIAASTPKGDNPENWFFRIANDDKGEWVEYYAPTLDNPNMPIRLAGESDDEYAERRLAWITRMEKKRHPLVFAQEYKAEFVNWAGASFFSLDKLLLNGQPVDWPTATHYVFATMDTAVKTGKQNDMTAVAYWSLNPTHPTTPLVLLDWDMVQIEGATLKLWIPEVQRRLEALAESCRAIYGTKMGIFVEDKQGGSILLQEMKNQRIPVRGIEGRLTQMGKDERAILCSTPVYSDKVKISKHAYDKKTSVKGFTRNHFLAQVMGYRVGAEKTEENDDGLDAFCYGIAIALIRVKDLHAQPQGG